MISYIILHYKTVSDTINCVNSIIDNHGDSSFSMVIVDNFSNDNSFMVLKSIYDSSPNIKILENLLNYGFSFGNNIGCNYAINNFNPDFLCVLNNDIIIKTKDFGNNIIQLFNQFNFDLLGPSIWNIKKKYEQNPFMVPDNVNDIDRIISFNSKSSYILNNISHILYYLFSNFFKPKVNLKKTLHGSALIFSNKYFSRFKTIFPELTFMYGEESFLFYRKLKYDLIFSFSSKLVVHHNHSSSTSLIFKNVKKKWIYQNNLILIALKKLRNLYEKFDDI